MGLVNLGSLVISILLISCQQKISHPLYVEGGGVFDAENNFYKTVIIGSQEWMAENLKTDLFCNGDSIPYSGTNLMVQIYDNDVLNEEVYGKLYNYQAVLDTSGLCPCGWHVPTELDYAVLINYLGGHIEAMTKMKSIGSLERGDGLWTNPDYDYALSGTNTSGFDALPAGGGSYNFISSFYSKGEEAYFWALPQESEDAIWFRIGVANYIEKVRYEQLFSKYYYYYSVRCIKTI